MGEVRPLIGVTPWYDYEKEMPFVRKGYFEGIMEAGGLPVLLPYTTNPEILGQALDRCDGLLLTGGPDVDPALYGEKNLACNGFISPERDALEIFLTNRALAENRPILGICRGMQVMNVAGGGTLYQDIGSQLGHPEKLKHSQEAPKWFPTHEITLEKGSRVRSWFDAGVARVNSFHHQAVKASAKGYSSTAHAPDGVAEAMEHDSHPFAVGVQWHPELMWQMDSTVLRMFRDFVRACGKQEEP